MTKQRWIGVILLAAGVAVVPTFAQPASQGQHDHEQAAAAQKTGRMGADHQQMMVEMKAADDRLEDLVSKMNKATGDQKVNAMAELLTKLVADQRNMHQRMTSHGQMMPQK